MYEDYLYSRKVP